MPKGVYVRSERAKAACRANASCAKGFHGTHSDAAKEKMRAAKLGRPGPWAGKTRKPHSVETKERMREAKRLSGFSPSVETRRLAARALRSGPTGIERRVSQLLTGSGVGHFNQFAIGPYLADVVVPRWNLVIECDGTFWHTGRFANEKKARTRDAFIEAQGIGILHLPEDLIKDDTRLLSVMQSLAYKGVEDVRTSI